MTRIAKVLVTAAGGIIGQSIIKSLKLSNKSANSPVTYDIFGTDMDPLAAGLYRCHTAILVPPATSKDYIDEIIKTCKNHDISAIFVGSDAELLPLSTARETMESESGAKILASPKEIVTVARDKWKTFEFCKTNNLPFVDSALPSDSERFIREFGFPLVVKPREGYGSVHFSVVHNREQMEKAISAIQASGWRPMLQRYLGQKVGKATLGSIEGINEFTTGVTIDKTGRKAMSSISMKKILKSGQTYKAIVDDFQPVRTSAEEAAMKLKAIGPVNVQAILEDDVSIIFEINARLSATCAIRAAAGVNEPDIIYRNFILGEDVKVGTYQKLICMRYLNEVYLPFSGYSRMLSDSRVTIDESGSYVLDYF